MALYVATAWVPWAPLLIVGIIVNAVGRSLMQPTHSALVSKLSDPRHQGTVFGFFHGVMALGRVVGPVIAGVVYKHHHTAPFSTGGAMLLMSAGWLLMLRVSGSRFAKAAPRTGPAAEMG